MDTSFLSKDEAETAKAYEEEYFQDHEAWIRFWNKNSIQLDGDFSLEDLRNLVMIMEAIK